MYSLADSMYDKVGKKWSLLPYIPAEAEEGLALGFYFYLSSTNRQISVPFYLAPHCPHCLISLVTFLFTKHPKHSAEVLPSVMKKGWLCCDYRNIHMAIIKKPNDNKGI